MFMQQYHIYWNIFCIKLDKHSLTSLCVFRQTMYFSLLEQGQNFQVDFYEVGEEGGHTLLLTLVSCG